MSRFPSRSSLVLCALLVVLAIPTHVVRAENRTSTMAKPVPTNCNGVTNFTHLEGWTDSSRVDSNALYLLNLYYSADPANDGIIHALHAGLSASLEAGNYTTGDGRSIVVVNVKRGSLTEDLPDVYVNEAVCCFGERLIGVIGPYGDRCTTKLLSTNTLPNNNLVALGPYTGSSFVRYYTKSMYFMRADPMGELFAMLNYIVNGKQHRRVGYAYLTNNSFGDMELVAARGYLKRAGSQMVGVYTGDGNGKDVNEEELQKLVDAKPQSIIVYGHPGVHTLKLLKRLLSNEQLTLCSIMVPSFLNYHLVEVANAIEKETDGNGHPLHSAHRDRLLSTSTNFGAYETYIYHIQKFRKDMTDYITKHPGQPYTNASVIDTEPSFTDVMINGWIVGEMLLTIFERENWTVDRASLKDGLFQQNRYIIGKDFVLGDYGGDCYSELTKTQGAMCECNQGGKGVVVLHHYPNKTQRIISDAVFSYSNAGVCYAKNVRIPLPVNMITLNYEDNALFQRITQQLAAPAHLAAKSVDTEFLGKDGLSYNVRTITSHMDTAQHDLDTHLADHRVDAIIGPVLHGTKTANTLIISPMYRKPRITQKSPRKILIHPTLEQQLYMASTALKSEDSDDVFKKGSAIRVMFRGLDEEDVTAMKKTIKKTVDTFRLKRPRITSISDSEPLADTLDHNVATCLLGLQSGDAITLAHYLEQSPRSIVFILFEDVMMYYDELVEAFAAVDDSVRQRLAFTTNYPMWNDESAESYEQYPILKSFHFAMGDAKYHTPRAFETYLSVRLIEALARSLQQFDAEDLYEQLYANSNFVIDNFRMGPYTKCAKGAKNCKPRNFNAYDMSVVTFQALLNKSQSKLYGPVSPTMTYKKRPLTTAQIAGIAVGGGLAFIALVVLSMFLWITYCTNSRDNKNAPKDTHDPVTLIFTDIESSTALWGTVPQIMPDAVATHHKIVREVIAAHKCYEVKTVGDSFMIACKQPFAAVQIAQDIQKRFLTHDWAEEIDDCYRQFEQRRADDPDNDSYTPHSANLVRGIYEALWHGLRVRIGVHTGLADIRHDEITGGFDYYGETSNMAARTEAIANGGQVLLTDATWWALSQAERDALDATSLGSQPLRGVGYPVTMYQLNVATGRQYPPLRLDIDACLPNDDETDGDSTAASDMASSAATLTGPAAAIATVLTNCFSPYPAARRVKELQPLLQKWGIPVPPRHRNVSEEDYCRGRVNRLALKMSSVIRLHEKMNGNTPGLAGGSTILNTRGPSSRATPAYSGNPLDFGGSLNSLTVARLGTRPVAVRRRNSLQSGRLPASLVSPLTSPTRSASHSPGRLPAVGLLEMAELESLETSPLSHGRPSPRRRFMALAAHSSTSEARDSIHVMMPGHVQ